MAEIIIGEPGTTWTNDTGKARFQLRVRWQNTCGQCAQIDGAVGPSFGIPLHFGCSCVQLLILPGATSQPFTDFRKTIDALPEHQRVRVVGKAALQLIDKGVVTWEEVVTPGRVRDLREVVSRNKLTVDQLVKAGVSKYTAEEAVSAVNTAAHHAADTARNRILAAMKAKGLSNEQIKKAVGERLAGRVSIGAGPSGPQPMPVKAGPPPTPLSPEVLAKVLGIRIKPPAPVEHPHVPDRTEKPGGRDTVKPMPESTPGEVIHPFVPERNPDHEPIPGEPLIYPHDLLPVPKPIKPAKPKPIPAFPPPNALPDLTDVRALGGHGGGQATLVIDPATGKKYVRKLGAVNPGQLREEAHADAAYQALGVPTAKSKVYETAGSHPVKLAEFHDGVVLGDLRTSDPAAFEAACARLRKNFVADALLGNWDVVGAGYDNILVGADGIPRRIDNGGSLRYRAQGALKGHAWGGSVGELDTLRDASMNPTSAAVFGKLTAADIKAQAKAVVKKRAAVLAALPAELHEVMSRRFDYLQSIADAVIPKPPKGVKGFKPLPAADFKEHTSTQAAVEWGMRSYKDWGKSLSPAEAKAVEIYTGPGSAWMNPILRAGDYGGMPRGTTKEKADKLIADLEAALRRAQTPEAVVIKRGAGTLRDVGHTPDTLRPGMPFVDKGFMSATPTPKPYATELQLVMRFPAGAPGAYVNTAPVSSHPHENEFLIPTGTLFRVVSHEKINGKDVVTLQYEGQRP